MSQDMKALMATVDQQLGRQQDFSSPQPPPLAAIPESPRPADTAPASAPATVEEKQTPQPQKPKNSATVSKPATNPYMLGSAFKRGRVTTREGIRQKTRKDASEFLAQNAIEPGIMETPTGLQYRIVHSGSGKMPTMADKVIVDYLATTADGKVLDEHWDGWRAHGDTLTDPEGNTTAQSQLRAYALIMQYAADLARRDPEAQREFLELLKRA